MLLEETSVRLITDHEEKDIVMLNSVVDISGINRISSRLISMAAYSVVWMYGESNWKQVGVQSCYIRMNEEKINESGS